MIAYHSKCPLCYVYHFQKTLKWAVDDCKEPVPALCTHCQLELSGFNEPTHEDHLLTTFVPNPRLQ
jgi:hypothetical protein